MGGLIRTWEIQAGAIRHALAIALTRSRMEASYVPPAGAVDGDSSGYGGTIPMGQLIALPRSTSIDSLGLTSPVGRLIAQALQTYGAYVVDTTASNPALYAEPGAAALVDPARDTHGITRPPWNAASDLGRIVTALRCVTNNSPASWGGPGPRLAAPAPAFDLPRPPAPSRARRTHHRRITRHARCRRAPRSTSRRRRPARSPSRRSAHPRRHRPAPCRPRGTRPPAA